MLSYRCLENSIQYMGIRSILNCITFMLQNLAAVTVSIANIQNYLITTNQCIIIIHIKYNIKIKQGRLFLIITKRASRFGKLIFISIMVRSPIRTGSPLRGYLCFYADKSVLSIARKNHCLDGFDYVRIPSSTNEHIVLIGQHLNFQSIIQSHWSEE